jgi:hypothetical protein
VVGLGAEQGEIRHPIEPAHVAQLGFEEVIEPERARAQDRHVAGGLLASPPAY